MIKRTLYFNSPVKLRLKMSQLYIKINATQEIITIPIEDVGLVILDNQQITISQGLIQVLQSNKVAIMICDKQHMPQSMLLPLEGNSIQQERYDRQLDASVPMKKQLWAQTVSAKIVNQSALLTYRNINNDYLKLVHKKIRSGDTLNCEAQAAVFYWKNIFPKLPDFRRDRNGLPPNNYLNYGYTILRATLARSLVMAGLIPTRGIFHSNRYNAFCLADDLMEPYRPYVDKIVCDIMNIHGISQELTKEIKKLLLSIPILEVNIDDEKMPLMIAAHRTSVSLVKCFEGSQRTILYPEI